MVTGWLGLQNEGRSALRDLVGGRRTGDTAPDDGHVDMFDHDLSVSFFLRRRR